MIKKLLDNIDEANHDGKMPIFYKMQQNRYGELNILNPIDIALENNQVRALNSIIEYCVKYQNSYCFSFMFE